MRVPYSYLTPTFVPLSKFIVALSLSLSLEITFPIIEYSDSALAFHVSVSQPSLSNHSRTKNVVQHFNNYYLSLDCAERVKIYRRKYINNIFLLNTNKCV